MNAYVSLAAYYDALTRDVPYGLIADNCEDVFRRQGRPVKTVLDLACGTGTLLCLLAGRGYDMVGADASAEMLAVAADKISDLPDRPLLLCQPMEELDLYGTVDAAVCTLDALNYVAPEKLGEAFRRVRLFLEPGGVFLFDIHTPEKLRGLDGEIFLDETPEVFCVWRARYDGARAACVYTLDLFGRSGGVWLRGGEEHVEYAHEPRTLIKLLEQAGFGDIRLYDGPAFGPGDAAGGRLHITARRPQEPPMKGQAHG